VNPEFSCILFSDKKNIVLQVLHFLILKQKSINRKSKQETKFVKKIGIQDSWSRLMSRSQGRNLDNSEWQSKVINIYKPSITGSCIKSNFVNTVFP
jgi:hypothetical protein